MLGSVEQGAEGPPRDPGGVVGPLEEVGELEPALPLEIAGIEPGLGEHPADQGKARGKVPRGDAEADDRVIDPGPGRERDAERFECLGELDGREILGALVEQCGRQRGQARLAGGIVGRAGGEDQLRGHDGESAPGREPDVDPVGEPLADEPGGGERTR